MWIVTEKEENTNIIKELESYPKGGVAPGNGGDGSRGERDELTDMKQALASKTEEAQALQGKHLRLAAEFENYKKLAQKEQREFSRFANENILKEVLPIVDNLERAIQAAKDSQKSDGLIQGVELTLKQFLEALTKFGVRRIASVGEPFDPAHHQAVARVESATAPENTVVEEYQKGYLLHDRILRAAMVTVSVGPAGSPGGNATAANREKSGASSDT